VSREESTALSPIDLILITGFLGAGKTTLVNRVAETLTAGSREADAGGSTAARPPLGLLINDFGRVVVDGALVREQRSTDELEIFEVADGSIFCSCRTASFVAGLRMFARLRPKTLVVEASGMSDPSGLSKILAENQLASDYRIRRIICLVDAVRFPKLFGTLTAVERQVAGADIVLLNKEDLVDDPTLSAIEQQISVLNPQAIVERTSFAQLDPTLLRTDLSRELLGDVVSCSTPETRPAAMQLDPGIQRRAPIAAVLAEMLPLAYRIKGWVRADERWWYVSDNGDTIEWSPTDTPEPEHPGITLICEPEHVAALVEIWQESGVEHGGSGVAAV
jgi:G3E family GTPase